MTAVKITDAIKFGFVIIAYLIGIFIVGGIILAIGGAIVGVGGGIGGIIGGFVTLIGAIIAIIGGIIIYGALFGASYKIVADGVERGIESAGGLGGSRETGVNEQR